VAGQALAALIVEVETDRVNLGEDPTVAELLDRWVPKKRARVQRSYRREVAVELLQGEDADPESIRRKQFWRWSGPARAEHLRTARST
jgi:hypothetical protein